MVQVELFVMKEYVAKPFFCFFFYKLYRLIRLTPVEIHRNTCGQFPEEPSYCLSRVWNAFRLMPGGSQAACISNYHVNQLDQNLTDRLPKKMCFLFL